MFQASISYAQQSSGEYHDESIDSVIHHYHIDCEESLRPIEEPMSNIVNTFMILYL